MAAAKKRGTEKEKMDTRTRVKTENLGWFIPFP
jgi:hypothetical protein